MSKLKQLITDDMKLALKAQDKSALKAIRMILGAIKQKEIDDRIDLNDNQVMAVIQKMVKQRKDSISQFSDAGRTSRCESDSQPIWPHATLRALRRQQKARQRRKFSQSASRQPCVIITTTPAKPSSEQQFSIAAQSAQNKSIHSICLQK